MDIKEEYHDPDYPEASVAPSYEPPQCTEEEKLEKIIKIIRREFSNELEIRENEIMQIEQKMSTSRRLLHRLRYALVSSYYHDQKLQLSNSHIEDDINAQREPRVRAETTSILREGQRRLHPSVRKLLGNQTVDIHEIIKSRPLRNKSRKNYSAMVQSKNYTIPADSTTSLRPEVKSEVVEEPEPCTSKPKKVPKHMEPKVQKVVTLDDPTRNKMKHRYRLIVGNISKYAPASSAADRSTHKWLLYVRGPPPRADPSPLLTAVVARLHASYAPHHTVHVRKAPFHISRRGWGEFPAQIELHFPLPEINRPATIEHTIKLDRNYTGLQTLGAETLVDVWLYSTPEMLEFEYFDPIPEQLTLPSTEPTEPPEIQPTTPPVIVPKQEPMDYNEQNESWMDFFSKDTTELDVDEMIIKPEKKDVDPNDLENLINASFIPKAEDNDETEPQIEHNEVKVECNDATKKKIVKYIDSSTGKIFYLEMDRNLDLNSVQEIIINGTEKGKIVSSPIKQNGVKPMKKKKSKGFSLLKPEIKDQLKNDISMKIIHERLACIENDHCYLGVKYEGSYNSVDIRESVSSENVKVYENLCLAVRKFVSVRTAVNYLLKKIPIVTESASNADYLVHFPFTVQNEEKYWKLDFAKRRNIEWTRSKLINKILSQHYLHCETIWKTKQILLFSRLHGYSPTRASTPPTPTDSYTPWSYPEPGRCTETECDIKEVYPDPADITSLTVFNPEPYSNMYNNCEVVSDSDEDIDVLYGDPKVKVKREVLPDICDSLQVLPVINEEDRLRFMFIERVCADIGVELRNEDVGNGYSYSAVHAVILSAVKCFAEDLIRSSLAETLIQETSEDSLPSVWVSGPRVVGLRGVWGAARGGMLARRLLATKRLQHYAL